MLTAQHTVICGSPLTHQQLPSTQAFSFRGWRSFNSCSHGNEEGRTAEGKWRMKCTFPQTLFFWPPRSCHGNGNVSHSTPALESHHSCVNSGRGTGNRWKKLILGSFLYLCVVKPDFQIILIWSIVSIQNDSVIFWKVSLILPFIQNESSLMIVRYMSVLHVLSIHSVIFFTLYLCLPPAPPAQN